MNAAATNPLLIGEVEQGLLGRVARLGDSLDPVITPSRCRPKRELSPCRRGRVRRIPLCRIPFRHIPSDRTRCLETWRIHRGVVRDDEAGTAARVGIEDVGRTGVAAGAALGLAMDKAEVDETAQGGGGRLLANTELDR